MKKYRKILRITSSATSKAKTIKIKCQMKLLTLFKNSISLNMNISEINRIKTLNKIHNCLRKSKSSNLKIGLLNNNFQPRTKRYTNSEEKFRSTNRKWIIWNTNSNNNKESPNNHLHPEQPYPLTSPLTREESKKRKNMIIYLIF